jgi:hypothetical protein
MNPHHLHDERSRVAHALIAQRIQEDPSLLEPARARVEQWLAEPPKMNPYYARRWDELLRGPLEDLIAVLLDPGEKAIALRHTSPFAGILDVDTRNQIWREVRERLEAEERSKFP